MNCQKCGNHVADGAKFCHSCGAPQSLSQQKEEIVKGTNSIVSPTVSADRQFYIVPLGKFILLSVITAGLYPIFWFAKNWIMIKEQEKSNILPVARAIFGVFFFSDLATKVLKSAKEKGYAGNYSPIFLAISYLALNFLFRLPGNFWLLGFASILTFIPVLKAVLYNNEKSQHKISSFGIYRTGEIVVIVLGVIFWVLVLIGLSTNNTQENNSSYSKENYIKQLVAETKKQTVLPSQFDSKTTMVDIIAEPSAIRYQYVLHDLDTSALSNETFKSSVISEFCKDKIATDIMNQEISIEYLYTVKNTQETFFISFSKEDCLTLQLPFTTEQNKQSATSKTSPLNINDLPQGSYTPVKTAPVQVESSQLKIERCGALATSKVSEQNFLTMEQRVEALNKCNEPEWMFPNEKQPAYMSDVEWKDMLKRVCIEKLNKSLDELAEKNKNDAYNKYYSDCLNK